MAGTIDDNEVWDGVSENEDTKGMLVIAEDISGG